MISRFSGRVLIVAVAFGLVSPEAFAQRGGRGGGGRGGGGGMARGGGMSYGGGMPRGGGGGGYSRSPAVSSPRPAQMPARPAGGARPSTLPSRPGVGNLPAGGGRPGGVGGAGGVGGVGGIGNRPGIDSRPGGAGGVGGAGGIGNRPGIDSRPGVGGGNTINRGDVNVGGIRQDNLAGSRVDPGYGVRPPAYNNWRGAYWGYHQGWANGYWHGYHDNNAWGWGRFATGAALGVTAWALGSSYYGWGYASYSNPYYGEVPAEPVVIQQVISGEPQTVSVPALAYDYGQPIKTDAAPPASDVAAPAIAKFEEARGAFRSGDFAGALRLTDEALKVMPNDATLHEFRALVLFAVGKYDLAAGPLYAVLSVGPGWDWTTMVGLYPGVDVYTAQLRALESSVRENPAATSTRFVLAYHYITQGNTEAAVAQLREVVTRSPSDTLSAQLLRQFSKSGTEAASPPAPPATAAPAIKPGKLPGRWSARPNKDTTIALDVGEDGTFTWTVASKGKEQRIEGKWSLADDMLTLAQSKQGGALVGRVAWQADGRWNFRVIGTGAEDPGLTFAH